MAINSPHTLTLTLARSGGCVVGSGSSVGAGVFGGKAARGASGELAVGAAGGNTTAGAGAAAAGAGAGAGACFGARRLNREPDDSNALGDALGDLPGLL